MQIIALVPVIAMFVVAVISAVKCYTLPLFNTYHDSDSVNSTCLSYYLDTLVVILQPTLAAVFLWYGETALRSRPRENASAGTQQTKNEIS